jgi:ATP-binding cassette subfamily B protein
MLLNDVFLEGNTDVFGVTVLALIIIVFSKNATRYIYMTIFERISQFVQLNMRRDIYNKVQISNYSFFDNNKVGDTMARMTGDLEAIRHFVCFVVYAMVEYALTYIVAITIFFFVSWQLALLMFLVSPFVFICTLKQSRALKPTFMRVREQYSKLNSVCQENISGNRVVKAFTKEDYEKEKFTKENQEYYEANVNHARTWVRYLPIMDFLAGFMVVLLVLAGGLFVILGWIEMWQMLVFNAYLWAVNMPMRMFGWLVNDFSRFVASIERVFGLMQQRIEIQTPDDAIINDKLKGHIEFRNVVFRYDVNNKSKIVLDGVSLSVKPGETIGILGPTGSGKTTLVNLISRFYDTTEGEVLIDGKDVKEYDLVSLRKYIAYATQDVFLFSDTIEGNVVYGVPDAPMEDVYKATRTADADGFIREMEDGYDTIVGERGVGLSGGQKQRLALARAITYNPSILILDDTTSAVDMETEHGIQQSLDAEYKGLTRFIIASRISSVKSADMIIVLDDGKIIQSGKHEELFADGDGYYYQLFRNQYGDYDVIDEI